MACFYDNRREQISLRSPCGLAILLPTSREFALRGNRQPSRDAKVLLDRKIRHVGRDQTDPFNKSLTGIFRRPL